MGEARGSQNYPEPTKITQSHQQLPINQPQLAKANHSQPGANGNLIYKRFLEENELLFIVIVNIVNFLLFLIS